MGTEKSAADPTGKAILLYDGECPLCRKSVAILQRLDWLKVVVYQNARETERLPRCDVPLVPQRLLEEMHLVTPDRTKAYHGFAAFRWLAWRMPPLVTLAPLMYIPGVPQLGRRAYLWVARNRFRLVPCDHGVCTLPAKSNN